MPNPLDPQPEILLQHAGWVRRLARSLVADAHQAEDLAQEVLARALEHSPRMGEPLRGWLATVLRNLAAEKRRAGGRRRAREADAARPEAVIEDEVVLHATVQRDVVGAVLELDEPYRTALLLRYFEELAPRRIAARQGVPVATIKTRLARGRALLRARLDQRHGGDGRAWLAALLPLARPPAGHAFPSAALPHTAHLVLGAVLVNAKILFAVLALALAGTLAVVAWKHGGPSPAAAAPSAAAAADAAALAAPLEPPGAVEVARSGEAGSRTAVAPAPAVAQAAPAKAPSAALPAATVRGRVVDLASAPVAAVGVRAGAEPGEPAARTDAAGRFELTPAETGGELRVADADWTTVLASMPVRADTGKEAVIVAAPRLHLSGLVLDAASALPVEGAHLRVELPEDFRADFALDLDHAVAVPFTGTSGREGDFLLDEAPVCAEARLTCGAEGFLAHEQPLPLAGGRCVIALERAPLAGDVLRGRVVDLLGAPVAEARVSLGVDVVESDAQGGFAFDLAAHEGFTRQFNAMAADFGGEALVADTLLAVAPGALPARFVAPRAPGGGAPLWPAFVTLHLGAEPLAIAGKVVGAGGEPVAGARVWLGDPTFFGGLGDASAHENPELVHAETLLSGGTGVWSSVTTGADGGFRLAGLLDRDYTVEAMAEDTLLRAVVPGVPAGREHLVVELPVAEVFPVLAGTVVGNDGEPLAGVQVYPMCDAFRLYVNGNLLGTHHATAPFVTTDGEGRFRLERVPKNLVYLRLDGAEVLPLEWGRHVEGGLAELAGDRASELVIKVARRSHFQIELADPLEADGFALLDAAGAELEISEFTGNGRRESGRQPLVEGRSNPMAAPDDAATLVLYLAGEEVRRAPVHLMPGERTLLRP